MEEFEEWFINQEFYTNMRFIHGDALFLKDGDVYRVLPVQMTWCAYQSQQAKTEKRLTDPKAEKNQALCDHEFYAWDKVSDEPNLQFICSHCGTNPNDDDVYMDKVLGIETKQDWQIDWSQAPSGFDWWAIDKDGCANWYEKRPYQDDVEFYSYEYKEAPTFNYTGDWKDSLRSRP